MLLFSLDGRTDGRADGRKTACCCCIITCLLACWEEDVIGVVGGKDGTGQEQEQAGRRLVSFNCIFWAGLAGWLGGLAFVRERVLGLGFALLLLRG